MSEVVKARWVIGAYNPKSDEGKRVLQQALMGVGYYYLNSDRMAAEDIQVAFLRAERDGALPAHLAFATDAQILKLDEMKARRIGTPVIKTI